MTARELKKEVSSFCYVDIGEKDFRFISYANLALRTVFNEISAVKEHKIRLGERPLCYTEKLLHKGGEVTTLRLFGNSYSMLLSGKGTVTVTDGNGSRQKSFDTEETAFRGFLSGEAELKLEGNEDFKILSLATFEDRFEHDESRIRIVKSRTSYSMREHVADFNCFIASPTDENGTPISDVMLIDDKIIADRPIFGEIDVLYKRLPKKIRCDFPDDTIDIPESCEDLLGLLTSYFILLEDERERAEYFKGLYNDLLRSKKSNLFERSDDTYSDTNGWA